MIIVIIGAQWGDEGKGKVVDLLADRFDIVARYQGGHNAGHSVYVGDKAFVLRLLPSGIIHEGKKYYSRVNFGMQDSPGMRNYCIQQFHARRKMYGTY